MLSQLFCPTCGGPALQQSHEISCALCGNQALPEAPQVDVHNTRVPREMPELLEFEVDGSLEDSLEELGLAIEYFLGFMESYPELPQAQSGCPTQKVSYAPTAAQGAALLKLCTRFDVGPEALASLAVELYARRDS